MKTTLAIDFGSQNIGIALFENRDAQYTSIVVETLSYDVVQLNKKLGTLQSFQEDLFKALKNRLCQ